MLHALAGAAVAAALLSAPTAALATPSGAALPGHAAPALAPAPVVDEDPLMVGHPAPALSIEHFVQGEPVSALQRGTVYVVEFWATWCKPCIAAFPHLSDIQEKYADDVVVIGVSDESLDKVGKFMQKPGMTERARYRMATDPDGSMHQDWMAAARQMGIPCTFIVDREGVIRYIGHPMAMDAALARIVTGEEPQGDAGRGEGAAPTLPPFVSRHGDGARAWIERFATARDSGSRVERFQQVLAFEGMFGGPGGGMESARIEADRSGTVTRVEGVGARIDAVKAMTLPGMGDLPMESKETVVATPAAMAIENRATMGPARTRISRADAESLGELMPMPATGGMVLGSNPLLADPLQGVTRLLAETSLEVASEDDGVIVLVGTGSALLGMPTGMDFDPSGVAVRVELDGVLALPTRVVVGDADDPVFRMTVSYDALTEEPAADAFAIDESLPDLAPILRQQLEMMQAMAPPEDLPDEF